METDARVKKNWLGFKIMSLGVLVGLLGFGIATLVHHGAGAVLIWIGWFVAAAGMFLHFRQVFRELRTKQ